MGYSMNQNILKVYVEKQIKNILCCSIDISDVLDGAVKETEFMMSKSECRYYNGGG